MMTFKQSIKKLSWGQTIELPSLRSLRSTTHIIGGRYPCRSIALIPRMILSEFDNTKQLNILDPFMGSGTTAIEATSFGHSTYGLEVDPFAKLISEVSIHGFNKKELQQIILVNERIVKSFLNHIPDHSLAPKTKNIEYWFDEDNFYELLKLKSLILQEYGSNINIKRFFFVILSDIIRAASKAERQSL